MDSIVISLEASDGSECHVVVPEHSHISAFVEAFRKLLAFQGFDSATIRDVFGE